MESHKLPDDDKHRGNAINAINGTLVGASLVLVCLRVAVRMKITHNFGWDDFLIVLALVTAIIVFGMAAESVHQGIGRHVAYLHPQQVAEAVKWNRVGLLPLVLSQMLTKLSICVFLYRIFGLKKKWKWAIYPIALLNVVGAVAALVVVLAECSPVMKFWNQTIRGSCWPRYIGLRIVIFQGGKVLESFKKYTEPDFPCLASSAFCDFALAFLPVVFLWNVHIKKSIKFGIGGLMGLGVL
ncbi:MAG: hypothetical protein LQ351_007540 [Letrouitia transgressa]|nr:MAG: hypothetical protein LQ351_007540 [Letrouitia transgressa]